MGCIWEIQSFFFWKTNWGSFRQWLKQVEHLKSLTAATLTGMKLCFLQNWFCSFLLGIYFQIHCFFPYSSMFARKPLAESPRVVKQLLSGSSPFRRGNIWDKNDAVRIYFSFFGPPCYGRTISISHRTCILWTFKSQQSIYSHLHFLSLASTWTSTWKKTPCQMSGTITNQCLFVRVYCWTRKSI